MSEYKYRNGRIYTFAGTGLPGYAGDGGPAARAGLHGPAGLAVSPEGDLYIADMLNHAVRKVDMRTGVITTVAGMGTAGCSGDGGPATEAQLNGPEGVAAGPGGDLYIADSGNHRLRRVDGRTGRIETIAGTGEAGYNGDGIDGRRAMLSHPAGIAADGTGNVYCNDYGNDRIRKVDARGVISTAAGTGLPGYSGDGGPAELACVSDVYGLAIDREGNLYLMDSLNFAVRRLDAATGILTTAVGTGQAGDTPDFTPVSSACLGGEAHRKGIAGGEVPHAVEVNAHGDLFIAETGLNRIRVVEKDSGVIYTVAGTGAPGLAPDGTPALQAPLVAHGVRMDALGRLLFNDFHHHVVRMVVFSG